MASKASPVRHATIPKSLPSIVWSPRYEVDIGAHVFPTRKYRLVRERLLGDGVLPTEGFEAPEPVDDETLLGVHTEEYLRKIREDDFGPSERWRLEVPFSGELASAMRLSVAVGPSWQAAGPCRTECRATLEGVFTTPLRTTARGSVS